MTDKEIRVAIARMAGLQCPVCKGSGDYLCFDGTSSECHCDAHLPDYLNSHDALAPVLAVLSDDEMLGVIEELYGEEGTSYEVLLHTLRATPADWCEAILRAKGIYDVDNN